MLFFVMIGALGSIQLKLNSYIEETKPIKNRINHVSLSYRSLCCLVTKFIRRKVFSLSINQFNVKSIACSHQQDHRVQHEYIISSDVDLLLCQCTIVRISSITYFRIDCYLSSYKEFYLVSNSSQLDQEKRQECVLYLLRLVY